MADPVNRRPGVDGDSSREGKRDVEPGVEHDPVHDTSADSDPCCERRAERRYPAHVLSSVVRVRVRPGIQATLIDMSPISAQLETGRRLIHGSFVHVQFLSDRGVTTVRARVVRNHVGTLSACLIRYRSAVRFDRRLSWHLTDEHVQSGEPGPGAPALAPPARSRQGDWCH